MEKQEVKIWKCPRCNFEVNDYPAISRRDNKTNICSNCGRGEAMFDFKINLMKKDESRWLKKIK